MLNLWVFLCTLSCLMVSRVFANVVLRGNGVTLSFTDIAANFARPVNGSGEHGTLFLASPLDACSPLINSAIEDDIISPYVLIIRGGCPFKDKVRRAQDAGFKAAIIYNNDDSFLVARFNGMSRRLVKAMPSLFFTTALEDNCTSATTFCPVCKRDANTTISDPPATERTPLLSSSSLSSSSHVASRPMVIGHLSPSSSNTPSSQQSFHESLNPRSSLSSSATISNPFIIPSSLPLNSVYMPFYASPRKVSSSYSRSSIQQSCSPCHSESMASSSWSESTQSLPEC
ncbi:hypothetical protein Ccrd_023104 [Cynara cardunculus var. scolymus]|uniref:PA domain-containing protein n=1 Tax=Cynara cardunculus var. scolymus TaxID=59895 RepID=A0A124SE13_CYNCS|nr:hypothetical protein Ccrd_023104 [Cynara cardunculus var. scolymus]